LKIEYDLASIASVTKESIGTRAAQTGNYPCFPVSLNVRISHLKQDVCIVSSASFWTTAVWLRLEQGLRMMLRVEVILLFH
jgi:hypothetical protein